MECVYNADGIYYIKYYLPTLKLIDKNQMSLPHKLKLKPIVEFNFNDIEELKKKLLY